MIQKETLRVSIVIPVYNEADSLEGCLQAIARQTVQPFEVIVVDNNSTDTTAQIAGQFWFVRLLREPRQGVLHARTTGFDAARGDIIGRLDADTRVPVNWVKQVQQFFTHNSYAAVSGSPDYYDFGLSKLANRIDWPLRAWLARRLGRYNYLWGANMAVRRSAWRAVRPRLCAQNDLHEDFDLGIHLQEHGLTVGYEPHLRAQVSSRRIDTRFRDYLRYTLVSPKTYAYHGLHCRYYMYAVLVVCWLTHPLGRFIYRSYDRQTKSFSLVHLNTPTMARIDPTSNIA